MKKYLILSLAFAFALTTNAQKFFQKTSDGSMLWLNKHGYNTCLVKGMTDRMQPFPLPKTNSPNTTRAKK